MGQSVGEIFVNLGVRGTDKTVSAFASVKTGLSDMSSMSLEAKAGIVGAIYALQQMMSASAQLGTNLLNTSTLLGMSTKTLQEYNYAANQVGASNQEMEGTFQSLQAQMTKMKLGEGAPKWLGRLAQVTGQNIDQGAVNEYAKHPEKLLQLLQQYAQKEKDVGFRNEVLGGFNLSNNLKSGLTRGVFNSENFRKADALSYSDKQIQSLDAVRKGWTNLGLEIEKSIGNFNAKYGKDLIKDVAEVTHSVLQLVQAFMDMDKAMPILKGIDLIFKGWVEIFESLTTIANAIAGDKSASERVKSGLEPFLGSRGPDASAYKNQNNVTVNVHAPGNSNAAQIGRAVKDGVSGALQPAGRTIQGQGVPPR